MNILDLFSGAGGLTEGFRNESFNIAAHIEKDANACKTLLTREAFYYLKKNNKIDIYKRYLKGDFSHSELIDFLPDNVKERFINAEISSETMDEIFEKLDSILNGSPIQGIIGGPPCQAYSTVSRKRIMDNINSDERVYLYKHYTKFLKKYRPNFFIFENVKGLFSFKDEDGEKLFPKIKQEFENSLGPKSYKISYKLVNSADFGVPQKRQRIILIGIKANLNKGDFFNFTSKYEELAPTLRELFQDLPFLNNGEENNNYDGNASEYVKKVINPRNFPLTWNISRKNNANDLNIYRHVVRAKEKNINLKYYDLPSELRTHKKENIFVDRFKALSYDDISHTVVAHIAKDGHYYIHPCIKQNRSLTVREAARIQTFPDDFYFEGSRTSVFTQIGNAVPPLLSKKLALALLDYIRF